MIHLAEQQHDAHLLVLLQGVVQAQQAEATTEQYARQAAASYRSWSSTNTDRYETTGNGHSNIIGLDEMPVGTLYLHSERTGRGRAHSNVLRVRTEGAASWSQDAVATEMDVAHALGMKADSLATDLGYYERQEAERASKLLDRWAEAQQAHHLARQAVITHEMAYTGWSRFFLVTSSAGHVHKSMNCGTCNWNTTYAPVVKLSGCTEAEAVAELGETLCTVCFPTAPVATAKITKAQATKLTQEVTA